MLMAGQFLPCLPYPTIVRFLSFILSTTNRRQSLRQLSKEEQETLCFRPRYFR
jgi:hypothetical protein